MGDNPFSPENNPFSMGEGGAQDRNPSSDGEQDPTEYLGGPAAVPQSTKPRQMPGGAAPDGVSPLGQIPGGQDSMGNTPAPLGLAPAGQAPAPQPMPFTNPVGGTNVPQSPAQQPAQQAVAIRNEILASNPDLDPVVAFTLAKAAVAQIQRTAYGDNPLDRRTWRGAQHPLNNPGHPYWETPQGQQQARNGMGPNSLRGVGPGQTTAPLNQKGWDLGYQGNYPAWVGLGATVVEHLMHKVRNRDGGSDAVPPIEQGRHEAPEGRGRHEAPGAPAPASDRPGRHEAPAQGRHEAKPPVATGPTPGVPHTQPGGPPTPHPHPDAPQPGEPSEPARRQRGFDWSSLLPGGGGGRHSAPRGRHVAASVYGED